MALFSPVVENFKKGYVFFLFFFVCGSKIIFSVSQKDTVKIMDDVQKVLHVYGIFLRNIAIATKKLPK